jgi:phosphoglycerate dehydrogenase-like enzyme
MSEKPIVIVDPHFRRMDEVFSPEDRKRLYETVEVVWGKDDPMPLDAFREALPHAIAVVCASWRYGDAFDIAEELRAILTISGGFPLELNYKTCFDRGIRVLSAAPAFARQVAEYSLATALAASRDIVAGDRAMRAGEEKWQHAGNVGTFLLFGKTVGMIGYGNLARELRPLLAPFGCPLLVYDPWLSEGYLRSQGVEPVGIERLMKESKVIFVLAVPTSENRALLSQDMLELIRPGAVLVLMSRAHVIDFEAMTDLVMAGRFRAVVDVFPKEPFDPNHPIRQAEGVILSAHRAGSVQEGLWEIGQMTVDDLEAIVLGVPPCRLQKAEPELALRYVAGSVPAYDED